jgi:hypothetical protein
MSLSGPEPAAWNEKAVQLCTQTPRMQPRGRRLPTAGKVSALRLPRSMAGGVKQASSLSHVVRENRSSLPSGWSNVGQVQKAAALRSSTRPLYRGHALDWSDVETRRHVLVRPSRRSESEEETLVLLSPGGTDRSACRARWI